MIFRRSFFRFKENEVNVRLIYDTSIETLIGYLLESLYTFDRDIKNRKTRYIYRRGYGTSNPFSSTTLARCAITRRDFLHVSVKNQSLLTRVNISKTTFRA